MARGRRRWRRRQQQRRRRGVAPSPGDNQPQFHANRPLPLVSRLPAQRERRRAAEKRRRDRKLLAGPRGAPTGPRGPLTGAAAAAPKPQTKASQGSRRHLGAQEGLWACERREPEGGRWGGGGGELVGHRTRLCGHRTGRPEAGRGLEAYQGREEWSGSGSRGQKYSPWRPAGRRETFRRPLGTLKLAARKPSRVRAACRVARQGSGTQSRASKELCEPAPPPAARCLPHPSIGLSAWHVGKQPEGHARQSAACKGPRLPAAARRLRHSPALFIHWAAAPVVAPQLSPAAGVGIAGVAGTCWPARIWGHVFEREAAQCSCMQLSAVALTDAASSCD